jgi:basic amino acid/polyamine antiporter, APA family
MAVAVGWTASLNQLLGQLFHISLPPWLISNTIDTLKASEAIPNPSLVLAAIPFQLPGTAEAQTLLVQKAFNIPAFLIVLLVTGLLIRGVSENAKQAAVMVFLKTLVILLFIGCGLFFFANGHADLLQKHWFAEGWNTFAPFGWNGVLVGASTVFFAYIGFDAVACAAEETKNPQRDIPIGIIGSLAICTVLYILVTAVITGVVPLEQINKEAAVVHAMSQMNIPGAGLVVSLGAIAGLTSVLLVLQMAGIRVFYAIARDGLLPKVLAKIHPKYATPHITTIVAGLFVALGSGLLPITLLAHMCNIGTLGAFVVVCAGVLMLRLKDPNRHRPFKAPLGLTFPIGGILGCLFVMRSLPPETWAITIVWFVLGLGLYFAYGFKNSHMAKAAQTQEALPLEASNMAEEHPSLLSV